MSATRTGSPATTDASASTPAELEAAVARVRDAAQVFATLDITTRVSLLRELRARFAAVAPRMVAAGCAAKGLRVDSAAAGEEWATSPWPIVRQLRLLDTTLVALAGGAHPPVAGYRDAPDGRLLVRVQPADLLDRCSLPGISADVRMLPGVDRAGCADRRGSFYKRPAHAGRVALVLGAGNVASIPMQDVLTRLFNDGTVCVLKMNPVNAYLGPLFAEACAPLIDAGWLAIVYGGGEVGACLATHPDVDEIHITGSDRTYDAIVWGATPDEQRARKAARSPLNNRPVSAELGNILPVLLVPGPYSARELAYQARDVAGYVTGNASFWCTAAKMLVLPRGAGESERFLLALGEVFARTPTRKAYYPGAFERWQRLTAGQPDIKHYGEPAVGELPWTLVRNLDPAVDQPLFRDEPFCSILSQTSVGSSDPLAYLQEAVAFCNTRLWGTLTATLIVHPRSLRDPTIARAVEEAIAALRYGSIGVNVFPGLAFGLGTTPWGAFPGAPREDIQSGCGFVHNTSMLEDIEKVIVRGPLWQPFPQPYHPGHRSADRLLQHLCALEHDHRWSRLPGLLGAALGA